MRCLCISQDDLHAQASVVFYAKFVLNMLLSFQSMLNLSCIEVPGVCFILGQRLAGDLHSVTCAELERYCSTSMEIRSCTCAVFLTRATGAPLATTESARGLAIAEAAMAAMGGNREAWEA